MEQDSRMRRDAQSSTITKPKSRLVFQDVHITPEELISPDGVMDYPCCSDLGNASWKIPGLYGISKLESQLQG